MSRSKSSDPLLDRACGDLHPEDKSFQSPQIITRTPPRSFGNPEIFLHMACTSFIVISPYHWLKRILLLWLFAQPIIVNLIALDWSSISSWWIGSMFSVQIMVSKRFSLFFFLIVPVRYLNRLWLRFARSLRMISPESLSLYHIWSTLTMRLRY
jgi:hypothetical protein